MGKVSKFLVVLVLVLLLESSNGQTRRRANEDVLQHLGEHRGGSRSTSATEACHE
jgi:hypothetical protein